MVKLKLSLVLTSALLMQGCQTTTLDNVQKSMTDAVGSVKTSWEEAKKRNAEKRAKWYYNNKPLMAATHRNGKAFNVNGKKDTLDGFRDFKWSQPLNDKMSLIKHDGLLSYYRYQGDIKQRIGGANLSDIQFVYFDSRLHSVVLKTDNDTDGQALLTALDFTFGTGVAPDFPSQKPWQGKYSLHGSPLFVHSNIFHYNKHYGWGEYDCFDDNKPCQATLYSKLEEYKHQEAVVKQANQAENDF